jgi:hypothetical protein
MESRVDQSRTIRISRYAPRHSLLRSQIRRMGGNGSRMDNIPGRGFDMVEMGSEANRSKRETRRLVDTSTLVEHHNLIRIHIAALLRRVSRARSGAPYPDMGAYASSTCRMDSGFPYGLQGVPGCEVGGVDNPPWLLESRAPRCSVGGM